MISNTSRPATAALALALVGLALALTGAAVAGCGDDVEKGPQVRFFKNVDPDHSMTQILLRGKLRPGYGNAVDIVEVDRSLDPITGDTLQAWVQHYRPGQEKQKTRLLRKSQTHDLLVHCFPDEMPPGVREDNVVPETDSLVFVYPLVGSDYTVVSGEETDVLDFMTAHQISQGI